MENQKQKQPKTVEEVLKSQLLAQKTTTKTFRFSGGFDAVYNLLRLAYETELTLRHCKPTIDIKTEANIRHVAYWLVDEDKKSGLYLCGICGSGKTTMMRAIRNLIDLSANVGWQGLNRPVYSSVYTATEINEAYIKSHSLTKIQTVDLLFLDDLGTESVEIQEYGNIIRPTELVLSYRYEHQLPTIISTNLKPSEIKERYGVRLADRFREMFLRVTFGQSKSYRQ